MPIVHALNVARTCIATVALCGAFAAQADVAFDNGPPDQVSGVNMNAGPVADDFTLGAATTLTNLRFWSLLSSASDYSGTIGWRILGDASGAPGSAVASGSLSPALTATGASSGFGAAEYVFDIGLTPTLAAGTYWIELSGLPLNPVTPTDMLWETSSAGVGSKALYFDAFAGEWVSSLQDVSFVLEGVPAVPEPSMPALALAGLAVVAAVVRRRKA